MVLLGDQQAVCRDTRVTWCPFEGHPCLSTVTPDDVADAVEELLDHIEHRSRCRAGSTSIGSPPRRST
jgi:hypothetical protein